MIESHGKQIVHFDNPENLPLFLGLKNQPDFVQRELLSIKRELVLQEFKNLEPNKQFKIEKKFSRFSHDPGVYDEFILDKEKFSILNEVDKSFTVHTKHGVAIYNKRSLLSTAEAAILSGQKVAFVKFDVNYLRLADKAGYADFMLRDLSTCMNEVAEKHQDRGVTAYRTGGDTFCFFVSSDKNIDQGFLKQLRQQVIDDFSKRQGFYMINEKENLIINSRAKIKEEDEAVSIINARRKGDSEKILRTLVSGRVPDKKDLEASEVANDELKNLTKISQERLTTVRSRNQVDLENQLKVFSSSHPELKTQIKIITELIHAGKSSLADYLLSTLESYFIDPLLDENVYEGGDYFKHLELRKKRGNEKIIYAYFPWLKNMNTELGETAVDLDIKKIYQELSAQDFQSKDLRPRARKDGGDFIFLTESFPKQRVIEVQLDNANERKPFKGKIPIFLTTVDYPNKGQNISLTIENMKSVARSGFIDWLDKIYKSSPKKASEILNYYLSDRTEDRCRELIESIDKMTNVSKEFIDHLESVLKDASGTNQMKIYNDFGITPHKKSN